MKPDGSDVKKLVEYDYGYFEASWSPDLSRIVASGQPFDIRLEHYELYILDNVGNFLYQITGNGNNPVWSPTGRRIAFQKKSMGFHTGNYIINLDGSKEEKLRKYSNKFVYIQDWSKDGKRLLVLVEKYEEDSLELATFELYEMDLKGNLIEQISNTKDIREYDAQWSPDEDKIAFSTIGLYRDIYIMNSDGTDLHIITPQGDKKIGRFRWSTDGTKIAFNWYKVIGKFQTRREWANLYTINIDGSNLTQITFVDSTNIINNVLDWR